MSVDVIQMERKKRSTCLVERRRGRGRVAARVGEDRGLEQQAVAERRRRQRDERTGAGRKQVLVHQTTVILSC